MASGKVSPMRVGGNVSDLDFTGERLVPDKSSHSLEAEHRARYEFAKELVKGKKVLDLGCGAGYGSFMLSEVAESVVGVDISPEAIDHAKETYKSSNLGFVVGDVGKLPFKDREFNACVCFEVIEHIDNPNDLLKEVSRILDPKGVFVISTPNRAVKISSTPNPFHKKEYTVNEFTSMLRKFFPASSWTSTIYGQFVKGKTYTSLHVCVKNIYLDIKGNLGIKAKAPTEEQKAINIAYEFRNDNAELAEYLLGVIAGKN
jgi:ubiquinone/menaquinone biosynthesis C-methylase UbiE